MASRGTTTPPESSPPSRRWPGERRLIARFGLALSVAAALLATTAAAPRLGLAGESPADSAAAGDAAKIEEKAAAKAEKEAKKAERAATKTEKPVKSKQSGAKAKGASMTEDAKAAPGTMPVKPAAEPQHVQVQHILVGFAGSIPGKGITRTKEEAKKLAYEILDRARKGEDFDALVRQYTEDSPPGIYGMSGIGVPPAAGEYPRDGMAPAFGNVGFAISPGNIGIADWDPQASPYGYHIIKRLK